MDDTEQDIDNTEEWRPKAVGRGLRAEFDNPVDPQWHLADSEHPYAPFPGNALKWESFVYDDGTTYEGLAREYIPHGKGVMTFGTGTGGGLQTVNPGDKYEGEFFAGFANGLGSFTGQAGEVYRGEWLYGKRHGCGALYNLGPFYRELKKGNNPEEAWKKSKGTVLQKRVMYGRWDRNRLEADVSDDTDDLCRVSDIKGILQEMESVVTKARMFQHKPDGDVTHTCLRDAQGVPVPVFQDPLHYPHGTKFMAPGPMGQCHPIPKDAKLREQMRKHARNYKRIYNMYNLPYLAKPGDDLFAAARLQHIQDLKKEFLKRLEAGEDEGALLQELEKSTSFAQVQNVEEEKQKVKEQPFQQDAPQASARAKRAEQARRRAEEREQEGGGIDESDLVASIDFQDGSDQAERSLLGRSQGRLPPTVFASISGSSHRAARTVRMVAYQATSQLLARAVRRRSLGRPQLM